MLYDFVLLTRNTPEATTFMQGFSCNQLIYTNPKFLVWLCLDGSDHQVSAMQNSTLVPYSARLN